MKNRTRQLLVTATITSILSILIGGFAIWSTYRTGLSIIDDHIDTVVSDVKNTPDDAINVALLSLDQNGYDMTLAFKTPNGEVTTLRESRNAILKSKAHLKIRNFPLQEGEILIFAASTSDIDKSLNKNLWRLLIFIIFANALAIFILMLISRSSALELERRQRAKMQEFLGDAAHELRTPLTVVKGYAELLEDKKLDSDREALAFSRLNHEIKRMESLIGDLLILAEIGEQEEVEISSVNLSELLSENIRDFQAISPEHHLSLDIESGVTLNGSEKYLQRLIQNALANIRIHTQSNVPVHISLRSAKEIRLLIEDGGAGLPFDSYGEKIQGLKRFDRSRSRETGGSGLGMSIMSAVVESHKGNLALKQSALGGLAIEVQLPRT